MTIVLCAAVRTRLDVENPTLPQTSAMLETLSHGVSPKISS